MYNSLEEKVKKLEKSISQKNILKEDKKKLLIEVEELKKILKDSKIKTCKDTIQKYNN